MNDLNIGQAAQRSGVSTKMIRHYEQLGLLKVAVRTDSGYRKFSDKDVHTLRFIRHSRDLGFSLGQIQSLIDLWENQERSSCEVKVLAEEHLKTLDQKIVELTAMRNELERLVSCCKGDSRPDCPILEGLAGNPN